MTARRETIVTLGPTLVSRVFQPIETRQTGVFHFTVQYVTTAVTLGGSSLTVRTTNVGRTNPASPAAPAALVVATNPAQTGFNITNIATTGVIGLDAASAGTYEMTFTLPDFGLLVYFDLVYGSGGGTPSFAIQVAAWSL